MKDLLSKVLPLGKFWTDAWSLVEGCTPVSPGCKNCWLAGMYKRNLPNLQADVAGEYTTPTGEKIYRFHGNVICREDRLDQPLRATKPRVYAIWSDLFHESVPVDFLNHAFDVMNRAKHHRFIIITKRPLRAMQYMASWPQWSPMPNVMIMVTMEDQQRVQERWKPTAQLAGKGWHVGILAEPLISPITIDPSWLGLMSWLITGGESGHGARPVHPDWVRSLRDQAQAASVPFLFKQWGEWAPCRDDYADFPGSVCTDWDLPHCPQSAATHAWGDHVFSLRAGKANTGRDLDGREWLEVP